MIKGVLLSFVKTDLTLPIGALDISNLNNGASIIGVTDGISPFKSEEITNLEVYYDS